MPTTGETAAKTAVYHSVCARGHLRTIALAESETFPPCGGETDSGPCRAAVAWQIGPAPPIEKP